MARRGILQGLSGVLAGFAAGHGVFDVAKAAGQVFLRLRQLLQTTPRGAVLTFKALRALKGIVSRTTALRLAGRERV